MLLWSIQSEEVHEIIQEEGVYRCGETYVDPDFKNAYDWLVGEMVKRIGPQPEGVRYPVWAMHTWYGKRQKPDFRSLRWEWGRKGEYYVCMEIDVPESNVVLSDCDYWHSVLNDFPLTKSEEEFDNLARKYDPLPAEEKQKFRENSWLGIFNFGNTDNDKWADSGKYIQGTFWELRKEQIRKASRFISAGR
ncbi:MAG: DUF3841 domain-containing protein [Anaerolineaceae bacterium]|nr:DUF3841 domain-containing protein [Anaerolineaceae bacterium]